LDEQIDLKCGIIDQLYDNKCFNVLHKHYIESGATNFDKVDNLLDIIKCRRVADLKKLVVALDRNGQTPSAELLRNGGGKSTKYQLQHVYSTCLIG